MENEPSEAKTPETPADKTPVIDPNVPLNRQVDKMLEAVPEDKDKDNSEAKKEPEKDETPTAKDKEPEKAKPSEPGDEGPEDEDEDEPTEPVQPEALDPREKYILDRLPSFEVVGHSPGGKDKTLKIKRIQDLPSDFELAGGMSAERALMAAHNANEINARELNQEYQTKEQQRELEVFQTRQAKEVAADLKQLQKDGIIPNFKYKETDARFNDDPAVKLANEIFTLFEQTNIDYGRRKLAYHISFRDAADKYFADQSRKAPKDKESSKETPEDKERADTARKVGGAQGGEPETARRLPAGSTTRDILRLYDAGRI